MVSSRVDLGAVLSLVAIAGVCVAVMVSTMPSLPEPIHSPDPAKKREKKEDSGEEPLPKPSRTIELERALREISGLALASDGKSLWAVHDEKPLLYRLSVIDGAVEEKIELGELGDYEAVEVAGGRVWVARSDGRLSVVDPTGKEPTEQLAFTKDLGMPCDVEGMAWDSRRSRLLLACKNQSLEDGNDRVFPVYALDLETRKLDPEPALKLPLKDKGFGPSGLAVHPKTGELWVVSSQGGKLVVLSPDGEVRKVYALDGKVHRQPEGIAFGHDGAMYISNEARGQTPMLYIYAPLNDS